MTTSALNREAEVSQEERYAVVEHETREAPVSPEARLSLVDAEVE